MSLLERLTLDVVLAFERGSGKPGMRPLPEQSRHPDRTEAPTLRTLPEQLDLALALAHEQGRKRIEGSEPALILVHGIFDRVFGAAFSPLLLWGTLLQRLQQHYRNRVYGFDHETLGVGPLDNAKELIAELPQNIHVDILCHSRGGLVTRALLQHPACQAELNARSITVGKVVFLGAANEGSPLAEPGSTDRLLALFTELFQERVPARAHAPSVKLLVETVKALGSPVASLPGLAALRPDSQLIRDLSGAVLPQGVNCTFVRANFGNAADSRLRVPEEISDSVFGSVPNDLVVPFAGMTKMGGTPARDEQCETLDNAGAPQGQFYHLNYLDSLQVRERIARVLMG